MVDAAKAARQMREDLGINRRDEMSAPAGSINAYQEQRARREADEQRTQALNKRTGDAEHDRRVAAWNSEQTIALTHFALHLITAANNKQHPRLSRLMK